MFHVKHRMEGKVMNKFSTTLAAQASSIGIELEENKIGLFERFYEDLIEKNKVMNLTAITDMHEVINKHFVDSLMSHRLISEYAAQICSDNTSDRRLCICDIGTGAGFPGIPLAIMYPKIEFTLVDSLNKRINFINEEAEKLNLKNVKGIHSRTEDLAHNPTYRESFDILVSRAVANMSTLSEYALPLVRVGGIFIAYKSADIQDEINEAKNAIKILGGQLDQNIEMLLPDSDIPRRLLVIKKAETTPKKYPRQAGVPSKKPLR